MNRLQKRTVTRWRAPRLSFRQPRAVVVDQALTPDQVTARLFIGIFPAGIVYCDRAREEFGDYKRVAFLPYGSLVLDVDDPKSPLLEAVELDAALVQARRGELFEVSGCGQAVRLGGGIL